MISQGLDNIYLNTFQKFRLLPPYNMEGRSGSLAMDVLIPYDRVQSSLDSSSHTHEQPPRQHSGIRMSVSASLSEKQSVSTALYN